MVELLNHLRTSLEGVLDQSSEDSSDYRIAHYLLQNCYTANNISIQDVADKCFVSKPTVSRFCRQIGYRDYQELNQAVYQAFIRGDKDQAKFFRYADHPNNHDFYFEELRECMDIVRDAATPAVIGGIVQDLQGHKRVGLLGKMQSQSVAIDLQRDLLVCRRVTTAPILPENQQAFIENSNADTYLLVISCSGKYIRGLLDANTFAGRSRPKITLLTNNPAMAGSPVYDSVVVIPCEYTYAKHPLALKLFCNLVAINYAKAVLDKR